MEIATVAGIISTSIYMISQIPMLIKAFKTRSLYSYSFSHILMNCGASLIHWCYVSTLPFGPIWFLHSFSTISPALMLFCYFRYEKAKNSESSVLNSRFFDRSAILQPTLAKAGECDSGKEISDFHDRFRPYVNPIYRGALILTSNPRSAEQLQVEIYMHAFMQYLQSGVQQDFKSWLVRIVAQAFSEWRSNNSHKAKTRKHIEAALEIIE